MRSTTRTRKVGLKEFLTRRLDPSTESTASSATYGNAKIYAFLGERERALVSLEQAFAKKNFAMPFVKVDPIFDKLHAEPRYQAIVRNMGL